MQQHEEKEHGQARSEDDEQVICSNELLKAIRERMAKQRKQEKEDSRREESE